MMITIIAPEWTLGFAAMRLEGALRSREQFKPLAAIDDIEWTLEHDFYANMGAFAIKVKLPPQRTRSSETEGDGMDSVIFHLTSKSLLTLRQKGYIKRLPRITKEQINDRSKSDIFTKLITATQVFSTIIQVIVRRSRNLAISQLELAVTAFSVCAMIIYLLTLYQPKGVQTIEVLHSEHQDLSFEKAYEICVAGRESSWFSEWRDKSYFLHGGVDDRIRNDWEDSRGDNISAIGLFFGGIIFGAVHCSGWFFAFPTVQELLLWRIASVLTTSVPIVMLGVSWFAADWDDWRRTILWYVTLVSIALYVIARLFIMVEAFRSLFYLPYDAFISTWADNIPHLS